MTEARSSSSGRDDDGGHWHSVEMVRALALAKSGDPNEICAALEEALDRGRAHAADIDRDAAVLALRQVVATLGPDELCSCPPGDETCGLRDEAYHALNLARAALANEDREQHPGV